MTGLLFASHLEAATIVFDLATYLSRIGVDRAPPATGEGLALVLTAQLRALCFENLDPLLGRVPDLDPQAVFDKIVRGRRGGYCFELNSLLHDALLALGFAPRRVLARVRNPAGQAGARTHLALIVEAGGDRWLADAGFGGPGAMGPLRLDVDEVQDMPNGRYRLADAPATGERVLFRRSGADWIPLYGFDESHVGDMDIAAANHVCATWEKAPFPSHLMLNGYDGDTRIGVFDRALTIQTAQEDEKRTFAGFADFREIVTGRIGLDPGEALLRAAWDRIGG